MKNKYILIGESISEFLKSSKNNGIWLVENQHNATRLQRHILATSLRKKIMINCKTMVVVNKISPTQSEVLHILIAKKNSKKLLSLKDPKK